MCSPTSSERSRLRPQFVAQALISDRSVYDEAAADLEGFWLRRTIEFAGVGDAADGSRLAVGPAPLHVVRRRRAERLGQLPRPPRRRRQGRQGRLPLRARNPRTRTTARSPSRAEGRGVPVRRRAARAGDRQGRRRRDLHGHGARAAGRDAGLRAARRAARVVFGGFSAEALGERLESHRRKLLDHPGRGLAQGRPVPLKAIADEAVKLAPTVEQMRRAQAHRRRGAR